jgi:TRAP-type transport system small permease protein
MRRRTDAGIARLARHAPSMTRLSTLVEVYFAVIKVTAAVLLAGMVGLVFGNVVLRYVFNSGIAASEELSRWLFVWLVFLGAIVGLKEHAHLGVDTLVKALSPRGRKVCYALSHALMLYASILLTEGSWKQAVLNWDTTAPASELPVGLFYLSGVVYGASATVILAIELGLLIGGRIASDDLIAVRDTEEHA